MVVVVVVAAGDGDVGVDDDARFIFFVTWGGLSDFDWYGGSDGFIVMTQCRFYDDGDVLW